MPRRPPHHLGHRRGRRPFFVTGGDPEGFYKLKGGFDAHRAGHRLCALRGPHLVRPFTPNIAEAEALRRGGAQGPIRTRRWPRIARTLVQRGRKSRCTPRSRRSSATSPPWATNTSRSRWQASTTSIFTTFGRARYRQDGVPPPGAAAGGVRERGAWLYGDAAPARGRDQLFRRCGDRAQRRRRFITAMSGSTEATSSEPGSWVAPEAAVFRPRMRPLGEWPLSRRTAEACRAVEVRTVESMEDLMA